MDIPLVLTSPRPGRLVYALPVWYRISIGLIMAVIIAALITDGHQPGLLAWILLLILFLCFLYEDRWAFDASEGRAVHQAGLLVAMRSTPIEFTAIQRLRIVPLARGTVPGSEEEKRQNEAALGGQRADDKSLRNARHKKPYLSLEIEGTDGTRYLIDHVPARQAPRLRTIAARIADLCGKPVSDN